MSAVKEQGVIVNSGSHLPSQRDTKDVGYIIEGASLNVGHLSSEHTVFDFNLLHNTQPAVATSNHAKG